MNDKDIAAALAAEEADLLRLIDAEPGYFSQLSAIFVGRTGWMNAVMMLAQLLLFGAGAYAGWRFFAATDMFEALRWGFPSVVLLLMSLMIKLALWPVVQANRILRAVKRLEMAIAPVEER